jgi:pyruvate,water dikinase
VEQKEVYWLEEIGQEYGELVGKKSANLGEMLRVEGIVVPPGFAISISAYEKFVRERGIDQEIVQYIQRNFPESIGSADLQQLQQVSLELRHIVESSRVPQDLEENIATHYRALCDKCRSKDIAVSVRSAGAKSHPGQYETYLNLKGSEQVLGKVVKVWSSIYNAKSIGAAIRQGIPIEKCPPVGVCVLRMVDAKAAGVCLTVDPISGDATRAVVESNWGLGESVVSGVATPDRFIVDKVEMRVKERVMGQKEKRVVIKHQGVTEEKVLPAEQSKFSLTDEEVLKIVELAKKLELHFGVPQDLEWAIDSNLAPGENVILLQTRPQVGIPQEKSATDKIVDMMIRRHRM